MMCENCVPPEEISKLDTALTEAVGMHGPWALAMETYDESGEPRLLVSWSESGTGWQKVGMVQALLDDLRIPFRRDTEER